MLANFFHFVNDRKKHIIDSRIRKSMDDFGGRARNMEGAMRNDQI